MTTRLIGYAIFISGVTLITVAAHLIGDIPAAAWRDIATDHLALITLGGTLSMFGIFTVAIAGHS